MYIGLHESIIYSCQILIKLEFSRQIVEKYSKINFHENPYSGSRFVPCGRTDRHDEATVGTLLTRRAYEYHHIQVTSSLKNVF
jgi:hypothetical protein